MKLLYLLENKTYVDQGEIKISTNSLSTSHIGTCSVLLFKVNKLNYMAHIDALQNKEKDIVNSIKNYFTIEDLKKTNIYIIPGAWCNNCYTLKLIKKVLIKLDLNKNYKVYNKKINWESTIFINSNGVNIT